MKFKKCRNTEEYIHYWTKLDDIIHSLRDKKLIKEWEKKSIPNEKCNNHCWVYVNDKRGKRLRMLKYSDIITNRYWYKEAFEVDRVWNKDKIEKLFLDIMTKV